MPTDTTQYKLYYGELESQRQEARGTITLRLRVEYPNVRNAVIHARRPPPPILVSVDRKIDSDVAHYTADGVVDDLKFSLTTLMGHIEELEKYEAVMDDITEALMTVSKRKKLRACLTSCSCRRSCFGEGTSLFILPERP